MSPPSNALFACNFRFDYCYKSFPFRYTPAGLKPPFRCMCPNSAHLRHRMCAIRARAEGDVHFNVLVELAEKRNHPVKREAAKLRIADAGELRVRNAGEFFGVACRKLALIEDVE